MRENYLIKEQIASYKRDGVIIVRDLFKPWINSLRIGFEKVLKNSGPHARENVSSEDTGRFFEDYCNWQHIPEFKNCIEQYIQYNFYSANNYLTCIKPQRAGWSARRRPQAAVAFDRAPGRLVTL